MIGKRMRARRCDYTVMMGSVCERIAYDQLKSKQKTDCHWTKNHMQRWKTFC